MPAALIDDVVPIMLPDGDQQADQAMIEEIEEVPQRAGAFSVDNPFRIERRQR